MLLQLFLVVNPPLLTTKGLLDSVDFTGLFHSFGATLFQNSCPRFLNQNFSEIGDKCSFLTPPVSVTDSHLGHPDLAVTSGSARKKKCSFTLRGCNFTKDVCLENMIFTYTRNCYPRFPLGVQ